MSEYSAPTQFIDLSAQQKLIRPQLDLAISRVLDHGQYIMGPEVKEFEGHLREFTGAKHALSCANGTDALTLVLMAWGIGPGDAVFVPSFTYVATAEAPAQLGATPFFVDVCKETYNIDPQSLKQAIIDCRNLELRPAVVIAVDLFGQPADLDEIADIVSADNIKVLVDGAQSFGATSNHRLVGTMGHATTTSFFPAKPLGCYGDGGAIFTDDSDLSDNINSLRLHGKGSHKYEHIKIGINSRLDTIQAAILIEKLKIFPKEIIARNRIADIYANNLPSWCANPIVRRGNVSTWAQYSVRVSSLYRNKLITSLSASNIPTGIYYPKPLHKQPAYRLFPAVSSGCRVSENLSNEMISLPMHPYLSQKMIEDTCEAIKESEYTFV